MVKPSSYHIFGNTIYYTTNTQECGNNFFEKSGDRVGSGSGFNGFYGFYGFYGVNGFNGEGAALRAVFYTYFSYSRPFPWKGQTSAARRGWLRLGWTDWRLL